MNTRQTALLDVIIMLFAAYGFTQAVREINRLWLGYRIDWCAWLLPVLITGVLTLLVVAMTKTARKKPPRGVVVGAYYANLLVGQMLALVVSVLS